MPESRREHQPNRGETAEPCLKCLGVEPQLDQLQENIVIRLGILRHHGCFTQRPEHRAGILAPPLQQVTLSHVAEVLGRLGVVGVGVGHESGDRRVAGGALGVFEQFGELRDQAGKVGGLHPGQLEHHGARSAHCGACRMVAHSP